MTATFHIGCAGWSIPRKYSGDFPRDGSHLQRYSARLNAVEINSSFYRPHRRETYARWAATVPARFRFSVKLPRTVTHEARLVACAKPLDRFFREAEALGEKFACVLVQLPPSLVFDRRVVGRFLKVLKRRFAGACVVEPRHASWFDGAADALLAECEVGRVAADPPVASAGAQPGGDGKIAYFRLHGSPKIYYSNYDDEFVRALTQRLRAAAKNADEIWCVFDNTALGFATGNALTASAALQPAKRHSS